MDTFIGSFTFMHERLPLMLEKTGQHVWMCAVVIAVSLVVAVPAGLWLGHLHRGEFLTTSISNIGRALPNLAVIAIGLGIFGLNFTNIAVALLITAVPPILSQAYLAVDQVDPDTVRAARGMGLTPVQVLIKVELPLALPLLFAGIRIAVVYVISAATLATVAGGGGLGDIVLGQANYGLEGVIAAALWVAALALLADGLIGLVQRLLVPKGLRDSRA
ncbi:ABC transporter permease subunit [Streptomyces sp. NBC_01433]|uniref:ABC transporter permease n=1 Tax=unclassified Streptomyces TaxID=2593676 RepID=UPI000939902B|nr:MULTISPECIES: ABC transporter permease subunit [unclassified Streptomyces]MCX4678863.1 ABC transporter permease subunit [Streptomyces sp. NBC_01433]OKI48598.1 ABC transporter permease [Streptomyces sp. TSRI0281]